MTHIMASSKHTDTQTNWWLTKNSWTIPCSIGLVIIYDVDEMDYKETAAILNQCICDESKKKLWNHLQIGNQPSLLNNQINSTYIRMHRIWDSK